jgi:RNA polymerase sigma factor (sigma-70 family)
LYRLAHGITRSGADAEEVVQDVFLQVVQKGAGFEGRAALGSWIYRITTNLPRRRHGDRAYLLTDWSGTPERELLAGESRRVLEAAINRLPVLSRGPRAQGRRGALER